MTWETYEDECPGCRPAILDIGTGQVLPESHPYMQAVLAEWAKTTLEEHRAFHRVTCEGSKDPKDIAVMKRLADSFGKATELVRLDGNRN